MILLLGGEGIHVYHWHSLSNGFFQEHLINISGIIRGSNGRLKWWLNLFLYQQSPIYLLKPGMLLYLSCSTDSLCWISLQEPSQERLGIKAEEIVHLDLLFNTIFKHFVLVLGVEGRVTT